MTARDTIAAIATPAGRGGIGIVRLSGPAAPDIARRLTGIQPRPRHAHYVRFRDADGATLDSGLLLYFPAPHSFTGEDVVELQGHGNPVLLDLLLQRLHALGARPARPGEFSERAFLEGRLDLAQAEAVADLIAAGSAAAARAAQRSLEGEFSQRVGRLLQALVEARLHVEAAIDFPEEEIDFLADGQIAARIGAVIDAHAQLLEAAERGQRLRDGLVVAIVGRPNAGKSSLLNALAGSERAIVTDIAGTTRDVLREDVRVGGATLTLVDTAGLRETDDTVEAEGVRRARAELARADHVVVVVDARHPEDLAALREECPAGVPLTVLLNKIDLPGARAPAAAGSRAADAGAAGATVLRVSLRTGENIDALRAHLAGLAGAADSVENTFSARARHVDALRRTGGHLHLALARLDIDRAGELAAEELRLAQQALSEITGAYSPDDLLGAIFSSFCIGK
ncbi:tRNA uridine-5-carboxymethylaminomethyl(34) synthesis GTPase MnmE [Pseudofulvimonas gallinarii]|uniref:tRNA modification GTPase MnmE n=1 Tax=Pseudofulvimonas gallinarii TaxID=634155 RepID=A0A4R3L3P7_9GAMM|nr:tRNA uridine-5-carboxymethylaminomethyl(34) synthesis GTPase MnmE [Pseudofulvimonas gallinarii]TCS93548.1 tRNA modification GTPase trmE [Pseudofulvimonas gallinarii]THD14421.1 tRNA uridine-5-carboxymethylaminomethyl(34) synthesis GTPase MnmE [Pseudofulvimonas gallinarii]